MPPEMAQCPGCGRERPLNEMPACRGYCRREFCGDCLDQGGTCLSCATHAPHPPPAGAPDPEPREIAEMIAAKVTSLLECAPDLVGLADDLACWSETLDPASCDTATLADIEALGTRAHDIMRRLRGEEELP